MRPDESANLGTLNAKVINCNSYYPRSSKQSPETLSYAFIYQPTPENFTVLPSLAHTPICIFFIFLKSLYSHISQLKVAHLYIPACLIPFFSFHKISVKITISLVSVFPFLVVTASS